MNLKEKINLIIKNPTYIIVHLASKNIIKISDKKYLKMLYKIRTKKVLNLDNPQTFNEKLQWLKLYDRNPEYTKMVDKYEVREYIKNQIGEDYLIPLLGVWDNFEDIDFDKLPNQFVLKCTHDSGGIVICRDKETFNYGDARKKLTKWLKRNFYYNNREWPYKNVKPRIIAEKYMIDEEQKELKDYKFFCMNGECKIILVCSERFTSNNMKETFFDIDWKCLNLIEGGHPNDLRIQKPTRFDEMKKLAEKLSKNIAFIRVDFYEVNGKVYFGELTFFPKSGFEEFDPEEYDNIWGDMIKLPQKDKIATN